MQIKVCCIASVSQALRAVAAGASAVGLVSAMLSGSGVIGEALIAEIAAAVKELGAPDARTTGL